MMKIQKLQFILISLSMLTIIGSCLKPDPLNQELISIQPTEIGDGLILSSPANEKVDSAALADIYRDMHDEDLYWQFRSMLVFRNGNLIAESYMKDDGDRTTKHLIWSCTKQVMGVLAGMALEEGLIESIHDPMSKYLPEEIARHPDKADISLRDLGLIFITKMVIPNWSLPSFSPPQANPPTPGQMKYCFQKLSSAITAGHDTGMVFHWVVLALKPPPGKWLNLPFVWQTAAGIRGSRSSIRTGSVR